MSYVEVVMSRSEEWKFLLRPFGFVEHKTDDAETNRSRYWALYKAIQKRDPYIVVIDDERLQEIADLDSVALRSQAPPDWLFALAKMQRLELRELPADDLFLNLAAAS